MALSDIVIETRTVGAGKAKFEVTGLSLIEVSELLKTNSEELAGLLEGDIDIAEILNKTPEFAAKIIALSAGEPDQFETVAKLPLGLQLKALEHIWDLTALSVEDLGKLVGGVLSNLQNFNLSSGLSKKDSETD